jgi:hypothetical protein
LKRYKRHIFTALSFATVAAVVFVLGLIFGAWDLGGSGEADPDPDSTTNVLRERDGVKMRLSVDKEQYGPGESVNITLKIENTNSTPIEYGTNVPHEAGLKLEVVGELADPQPLIELAGDNLAGTIDPGATIERHAAWDETLDLQLTPVTAPPGQYTVTSTLLMLPPAGVTEPIELGAAVTFNIEGTPYVQPPLAAMRAMVTHPEVNDWGRAHGDFIVCAYPSHKYFYNGSFSAGTAAETFDFLYRQQVDKGDPICGIATDGDAWRFVIFSANGEEPNRLTVHVALDEPVVLSVVEGSPAP